MYNNVVATLEAIVMTFCLLYVIIPVTIYHITSQLQMLNKNQTLEKNVHNLQSLSITWMHTTLVSTKV